MCAPIVPKRHTDCGVTYAVKIVVWEHDEELVDGACFSALGDEHVLGPAAAAEVELCKSGPAWVVGLRRQITECLLEWNRHGGLRR